MDSNFKKNKYLPQNWHPHRKIFFKFSLDILNLMAYITLKNYSQDSAQFYDFYSVGEIK